MNELKTLRINEQSIKTELKSYEDKPYKCLFEYVWNSFDAGATKVDILFDIPAENIGYIDNVRIVDNGKGWDFKNNLNTDTFLSSTKNQQNVTNKTLPKGKFGRGRYSFVWIAEKIAISSKQQKMFLNHSTKIEMETISKNIQGTKVEFFGIYQNLSDCLIVEDNLHKEFLLEFGWFLAENENYKIKINNKELNISQNIKKIKEIEKNDLPDKIREQLDNSFKVKIILWDEKPSEYSKFYFLDEKNIEIFKQNTGLNKKSDEFWHSVYITSSLFKNITTIDDENEEQPTLDFGDKKIKRLKKQIILYIKNELTLIRKPYLIKQSEFLLDELKEDNIIPELTEFGIYDEQSYGDLIKTIYTITPSLFTGKSLAEKKFICATFAGLLSTQDDVLIKTILEQLQELTEDEKQDLINILNRTSLSNIVKTIKEIDHRLDILHKLKFLISEHEKETLEVKHLQKILDQNFWIFGEQFRLFSSTEGALKNVLMKYAKEILEITNPELTTQPNGEVDLFLTKTENIGEKIQRNIIVELKRASKKLGKNEYDQLEKYMEKILEQNLTNSENQYWEFYLIGKDYNEHISRKIETVQHLGEKEKGLTLHIKEGRVKMYVRKWSDILEVEWGTKMKYLKEKLEIKARKQDTNLVEDIVHSAIE